MICVCLSFVCLSLSNALKAHLSSFLQESGGSVQVDEFSAFVLHGDGVVRLGVGEKKMGL